MLPPPTAHELLSLGIALKACGLESYFEPVNAVLPWLTTDERSLFIDLAGRFSVCDFNEYLSKSATLSTQLVGALDACVKHIVLLPLVDPTTQLKPKSGEGVAWLMSRKIEAEAKASGRTFEMVSRSLKPALLQRLGDSAFVLVDDFVGSGGTAEKAIQWLSTFGVSCDRMFVGCFVGLRVGSERIQALGANPTFLETTDRGISDAAHIPDKLTALKLMADVEAKNEVSKRYRLGYDASEALVLMCFCPNNTFPVFWWNGPKWTGAFTR